MRPYPRPDCGEAQIPGGWAVQLASFIFNYGRFQFQSAIQEKRGQPRYWERKQDDDLSTERRSITSFAKALAPKIQKVATNIVSAGRRLAVTNQNGRDTRERPRAG